MPSYMPEMHNARMGSTQASRQLSLNGLLPLPLSWQPHMRTVVQIAERNNLMHLLPYKTLEEVQAAYKFGCLQVSAEQRHLPPCGFTTLCPRAV